MKNIFIRTNLLKFLASFVFIFGFIFFLSPQNTYADYTCSKIEGCAVYVRFFNPNNQSWDTKYIIDDGVNGRKTGYVTVSANGSASVFYYGVDQYGTISTPVEVTWYTSCADPSKWYNITSASTNPIFTSYYIDLKAPDYGCHTPLNVTCGGTTYKDANYAACLYVPYNGNFVDFNAQCPQDTNPPYCASAGKIYGIVGTSCALRCSDSCGYGSYNSCTWVNRSCSGYSCNVASATEYSNKCGGSNIANTYMCSAWSATCSPPTPTVTATAVCNGANPNINVNYSANSGTPGNRSYDLRWKKSTDSWGGSGEHDVCSPPTSGTGIDYTITSSALENNTTYNVQVREHTDSGYNGPTNFGSATVTTSNCGSIISGNVYVDSDNDDVKNSNYTGGTTITLSNGTTDVTDGSGNYSITGILAGAYTVSLPASITGYYIPIRTSTSLTVPGDKTYNFRLVPLSTININVYYDYNGNANRDINGQGGWTGPTESLASGQTVTVTGGGATTYTTNGTVKTLSSLNPGSSTITVGALPSGWTFTTSNGVTVSYPPTPLTVNIGIKPPAPTCSSLTANPTSVSPGGTSTLTCNNPTSPTGGSITYTYYDDSTIAGDSVTNNNTNTSTWTAPNPYWIQDIANPSVAVCNPGGLGAACSNYQAAITIVPKFSISGNVFVDENKDGLKNGTDANYSSGTSTIQIRTGSCGGPLVYTASTANGIYTTGLNLPGGTYYVCYTSLPVGYKITNPVNGPPASFSVRVGNASTGGVCSESSNSATCDANGNITNLNYGITNSIPWIQTTGGDPYSSNGISNPIPSGASCGPYMSLRGPGGFPGVVYIGNGSADLGAGQASQNPYNWIAGGLTYPEVYTPKNAELKTSYNTMYNTALRSGITPTPLGATQSQCGIGGTTNCALSGTLANGVYIVANGSLTLTGGSYTFPANKDFVILVNGDLNINTEIHVPIGSSALFSVTGNINVANNVGEAVVTSTRANVEGYYSADKNFYAESLDANGSGANCAVSSSDRRLNIAGSVVVNASLTGGNFVNQRDLCAGNLQCPASTVIERPDFILNAPDFLKTTRRVWQEIAP